MRLEIPDHVTAEIRRAQSLAAEGDTEAATAAYRALFEQVADDTGPAVAVLHMWAIAVQDPAEKLALNQEALSRADNDPTYPPPLRATLLANLGYSHHALGDLQAARSWYLQAQEAAAGLGDDQYGTSMRAAIQQQLESLARAHEDEGERPKRTTRERT